MKVCECPTNHAFDDFGGVSQYQGIRMNSVERHRLLHRLLLSATGLALALGAFWFLWTVLLWHRLHPHLPWRDLFVILDHWLPLLEGGDLSSYWQFLIEPHYAAHRIALPRLIVVMDMTFFHGQNHLLHAGAWLGMFGCLGIYFGMARGYFQNDRIGYFFCLGVVTTLFFAPAHLWNLINAINATWHISFAFAFAAFFILLRSPGQPRLVEWSLAYGCATLAAFTTFTGVIVWLLLHRRTFFGWRNCDGMDDWQPRGGKQYQRSGDCGDSGKYARSHTTQSHEIAVLAIVFHAANAIFITSRSVVLFSRLSLVSLLSVGGPG